MKTTRSVKSAAALLAFALLSSALAGCSRDEPERPVANMDQPEPDASEAADNMSDVDDAPAVPAPDASIQSNAIGELSDEQEPDDEATTGPDQQVLDDASASGMTARSTRGTVQPGEAPGEVVEQK
jgi:hypothetical protein